MSNKKRVNRKPKNKANRITVRLTNAQLRDVIRASFYRHEGKISTFIRNCILKELYGEEK